MPEAKRGSFFGSGAHGDSARSRTEALAKLLEHAREMSRRHESDVRRWRGLVLADCEDGPSFLPGYIPYIGRDYFSERTLGRRTLAYALSQNLRGDEDFARRWADDWRTRDGQDALNRQNRQYESTHRAIVMHPFDTGHIPLLCALIRLLVSGPDACAESSIYDEVAATNLSKFSFRSVDRRLTEDRAESLEKCWDWFSVKEIEVLKPDFILCLGEAVYSTVRSGVRSAPRADLARPTILRVAFPSVRVINRWYRGHALKETSARIWASVSEENKQRKVEHGTLADVIERDMFYFAKMLTRLERQLGR